MTSNVPATSWFRRGLRRPAASLLVALAVGSTLATADEPPSSADEGARGSRVAAPVDALRVRPYGWIETAATTTPGTRAETRTARVFDDQARGARLQQAYVALERTVDEARAVDVGGKVAVVFGTDARLLHARGLLDAQRGDEQLDLVEAYGTVRVAVGCGVTVKVGKFATPLGAEVIDAPANALPSRSFLFGYAIPFTHAGVLVTAPVDAATTVSYGLVRGWDVWDDNNDAWTHVAGLSWNSPRGGDTVALNAIVGPEHAGDDRHLRAVVDGTWTVELAEGWRVVLNGDVGVEEAAVDGRDATWWGGAAYVTRTVSERWAVTGRLEVFRDDRGARFGEAVTLSGATLGVDWRPLASTPALHVRPELRWDHAFLGPFFDDGRDEDQFSLSLDVLFTF